MSRALLDRLSPNQRTVRQKVILAAEWMVAKYGIERVGLLTLSFGVPGSGKGSYETWELRQKAKVWEFVQARWHSFCTNVISDRYENWVCVFELHEDKVWHIHVIVVTREDIRTGTDVETLSNYSLPYWKRRGKHLRNEALAAEWTALRQICCRYRFGRVELLPVKHSGRAVGRYLGDYLAATYLLKPVGKRCRLVRFSKQINQAIGSKFSIHSLGQLKYRTKLAIVARMLNFTDYGEFAEFFGPRWNFYLKNIIKQIPMPFVFQKGDFASGMAVRTLRAYADAPKNYLEEWGQRRMDALANELWRRLGDSLGENSEDVVALRSRSPGDNTGDGPATADNLQAGIFDDPYVPF